MESNIIKKDLIKKGNENIINKKRKKLTLIVGTSSIKIILV